MCNCNKCRQQQSALVPELETLLQESAYGLPGEFENEYNTEYEDESEYEGVLAEVAPKPKMIWTQNTNLNAPCSWGRFNFLYNSGAPEAIVTFNTKVVYTQNFGDQAKRDFMDELNKAALIWDESAEIQIRNRNGNFTSIPLRFRVVPVTDPKNMNKRTEVFSAGAKATKSTLPDQEAVDKELNVFIGSKAPVLAHELGHVWGLPDEYTYTKKPSFWQSLFVRKGGCHVGNKSPLVRDTSAIMCEGITVAGEFRTRYFKHFGLALLNSFWTMPDFIHPIRHNGKVVSKSLQGRIALRKRTMSGGAPHATDQPSNPRFTEIFLTKRA